MKEKKVIEEKAVPEVQLSVPEKANILDQLFEKGTVYRDIVIIPKKITAKITSLTTGDQLLLEKRTADVSGSTAYVLHVYTLEVLAYTVKGYGDREFDNNEDARAFLESLPGQITDKLIKAQNYLERQIRKAVGTDEIEQHFFVT